MKPTAWIRIAPVLPLAALLAQVAALAQYPPAPGQLPPAEVRATYTAAQLDQMLAPIALYPDALLSQILMAATYPPEVDEAGRWALAHPGPQGEDAVRAVQDQDWDPSVKSLLAFPDVLQRMAQDPQWTEALGEAFLAQGPQVMQEIQLLRGRAQAAGQLYSDSHLSVAHESGVIAIAPANPQLIYVPYCNPVVVYGTWWWPSNPPVNWVPAQWAAANVAFVWGNGVRVAGNFFFGAPDWRDRRLNVVDVNTFYYRPATAHAGRSDSARVTPGPWRHDPWHRRNLGYRSPSLRSEYGAQPQTSPVSPARQLQLEQQQQYLQEHSNTLSPARQMQLQQQEQYEQRHGSAQQPSPASPAQRWQQQ
jgi:hypothetical protein